MRQSLEAHEQHSSELALSFLGATDLLHLLMIIYTQVSGSLTSACEVQRDSTSLSRGATFMGRCHHPETWLSAVHDTLVPIQLTVAMCNLFLMAIRDPSVTPGADTGDGARPVRQLFSMVPH